MLQPRRSTAFAELQARSEERMARLRNQAARDNKFQKIIDLLKSGNQEAIQGFLEKANDQEPRELQLFSDNLVYHNTYPTDLTAFLEAFTMYINSVPLSLAEGTLLSAVGHRDGNAKSMVVTFQHTDYNVVANSNGNYTVPRELLNMFNLITILFAGHDMFTKKEFLVQDAALTERNGYLFQMISTDFARFVEWFREEYPNHEEDLLMMLLESLVKTLNATPLFMFRTKRIELRFQTIYNVVKQSLTPEDSLQGSMVKMIRQVGEMALHAQYVGETCEQKIQKTTEALLNVNETLTAYTKSEKADGVSKFYDDPMFFSAPTNVTNALQYEDRLNQELAAKTLEIEAASERMMEQRMAQMQTFFANQLQQQMAALEAKKDQELRDTVAKVRSRMENAQSVKSKHLSLPPLPGVAKTTVLTDQTPRIQLTARAGGIDAGGEADLSTEEQTVGSEEDTEEPVKSDPQIQSEGSFDAEDHEQASAAVDTTDDHAPASAAVGVTDETAAALAAVGSAFRGEL